MPKETFFSPRTKHSDSYYLSLLLVLAECVRTMKTDQQIADDLSQQGLLSPTGKKWTPMGVRQALFKVRNFRDYPNRIHTALLQLIVDGFLKPSQVGVLFEPRRQPVM